jgi:hypothetical protein
MGILTNILQSTIEDIEAGVIDGVADVARAELFDDFLD